MPVPHTNMGPVLDQEKDKPKMRNLPLLAKIILAVGIGALIFASFYVMYTIERDGLMM